MMKSLFLQKTASDELFYGKHLSNRKFERNSIETDLASLENMKLHPGVKNFWPALLILASVVFYFGDRIQFAPQQSSEEKVKAPDESMPAMESELHDPSHDDPSHDDPSDPESERRMGIFHYNEGNKSLKEGQWEQAVSNYKMALHHDKNFVEVYVNMSSAYLMGKQYKEAQEALKTLRGIDAAHPNLHYNWACYYSLTGNLEAALRSIKQAVALGFKDRGQIETDPDLENLRQDENFSDWFQDSR